MPLIIIPARELGIKGDESPDVFNKNKSLLNQIELIGRKIAILANLGDVSSKVIPKISIISKPKKSGTITSRYFIPHQCHSTHAVTGSLALSAAIKIKGTTANRMLETECLNSSKELERIIIEHPAGKVQTEFAIKEVNDESISLGRCSTLRFSFSDKNSRAFMRESS